MPCFTPGVFIATLKGERPIEDLRPGDRIITRDHGVREIGWVGQQLIDRGGIRPGHEQRPVLIQAGSLGNGLPERDMIVSPHKRILVAGGRTLPGFEAHNALVPARHLVDGKTIRRIDVSSMNYVHIMCARHEVVLANGCWVECFQPNDASLNGFGDAQRYELYGIFPDLAEGPRRAESGLGRGSSAFPRH